MPAEPAHLGKARPFALRNIGAGLAFASSLPDLTAALSDGGKAATAVVQGPPGTGKTTLVPPLVANMAASMAAKPVAHGARIVVTQPRDPD